MFDGRYRKPNNKKRVVTIQSEISYDVSSLQIKEVMNDDTDRLSNSYNQKSSSKNLMKSSNKLIANVIEEEIDEITPKLNQKNLDQKSAFLQQSFIIDADESEEGNMATTASKFLSNRLIVDMPLGRNNHKRSSSQITSKNRMSQKFQEIQRRNLQLSRPMHPDIDDLKANINALKNIQRLKNSNSSLLQSSFNISDAARPLSSINRNPVNNFRIRQGVVPDKRKFLRSNFQYKSPSP